MDSGLDVQRTMAEHNKNHNETPVIVRIGLSVGEPVQEGEDYFGMAVNVAARITALARGGQVLVSHIVYALVSSSRGFAFRSIGEVELKGIEGLQALYEARWEQPVEASTNGAQHMDRHGRPGTKIRAREG